MIPGFGKQTITIGSDPQSDIVLHGQGVAAQHAQIQHHGAGKLIFVNSGQGQTTADGRQLGPGEQVAFDFRTQFFLGGANLPFDAEAISLCLFAQGQVPMQGGRLTIGRDPVKATLVIQHPSVSSMHCSLMLDRMMVTDHSSTSGTYVGGNRIGPDQPAPIPPTGSIHVGPVPISVPLLQRIAQAMAGGGQVAAAPQAAAQQNYVAPAQNQVQRPAGQAPAQPSGGGAVRKHKTVFGQLDFSQATGASGVKSIGRTPNNDICIPHPQVSSRHAEVEHIGGKIYVTDRGSANGTYVHGHRIAPGQKTEIQSGEKIYVGPMPLQLTVGEGGAVEVYQEEYGEEKWAGRPLYEIEAWSLELVVPDRDDKTKDKVLLDKVSFKALPGDMIALMGPSGAGKTTLLLTLNGYLPPTEGLVRINGEDLYSIYDTLRGSIGYVPQDDLVHPELTVREAVRYSAKFRLPPDFSDDEIDARVQQTLKDLGLEGVSHLQIGDPEKKVLSGGQRKRVNIALELVTDPVILYLDEPTSGLAADDAAALIGLLAELTKATGKTIIMTIHQPAVEEYEKFSHTLILGYGGVPMFYGETKPDSYDFFGGWGEKNGQPPVDNPRDMFANITAREDPIYEQLIAANPGTPRGVARNQAANLWRAEYFADSNPIYKKMYSGRRSVGTGDGQRGIPEGRPKTRGQFGLLLSRYFKCKVRDRVGTAIMLAQAPIIGGLLALVFGSQAPEVPAWCLGALQQLFKITGEKGGTESLFEKLNTTTDNTGAIFFLVVSAIWFGTSNAAREIVKERAIYLRERMVNLGLMNYVMSKFVLLTFFCIIQCTILLTIVFVSLGFQGGAPAFMRTLGALVMTSVTAISIGLLVSTLVTSSEASMALTPIALIPQVVLGGLMVPATSIPGIAFLMNVIPARWGFEAAVIAERTAVAGDPAWVIDLGSTKSSAEHFITSGKFECATAQMASSELGGAWSFTNWETAFIPYAVLSGMTVGIMIAILIILKRRDPV